MKTLGDSMQEAERLILQAMGELTPTKEIRSTVPERSCLFAASVLLDRALGKLRKAAEIRKGK